LVCPLPLGYNSTMAKTQQKYTAATLKAVNAKMSGKGDFARLAEMTGYNVSFVRKVMAGERRNALIVQAAQMQMASNEALVRKVTRLRQTRQANKA